jgi:phospholipase A2
LSEKWALLHHVPFPPIREIAKQYLDQPVQECYVFKDPKGNPEIPVVIFFPLVNKDFRKFKSPGVPRETEEEKSFGDFDIFDNTNAYAIWRFVYPNLSFDRMTAMMEFNIINNVDMIKSELAEIVQRKKRYSKAKV